MAMCSSTYAHPVVWYFTLKSNHFVQINHAALKKVILRIVVHFRLCRTSKQSLKLTVHLRAEIPGYCRLDIWMVFRSQYIPFPTRSFSFVIIADCQRLFFFQGLSRFRNVYNQDPHVTLVRDVSWRNYSFPTVKAEIFRTHFFAVLSCSCN